ncbi:type VI secretion system Vgr family protein [Variovorax boronicumulans]|uniref:type VI secretion system Vgr family protein n=1 Tax=Variovorax boronicumulans TaxID=436515 RepID=UPI001C583D88
MKMFGHLFRSTILVLMGIGSTAWAQKIGATLPRSETHAPTRAVSLKGDCRFLINDLAGGYFFGPHRDGAEGAAVYFDEVKNRQYFSLNIPLECTDTNARPALAVSPGEDAVSFNLGAAQVDGEWVPADGRDKSCDLTRYSKSQRKRIDPNAPCFYPNEHFKAITFQGKNWHGVGTLLDMTTGEPKFRQRKFSYCLISEKNPDRALCGSTHVRYLMKPSSNVLPRVLKVLTRIEFVEPSASKPVSTHRTDQKIQDQLKRVHQSGAISPGFIARIADKQGCKDLGGEGFEHRTNGHGATRANDGLPILNTYPRCASSARCHFHACHGSP